MLWSGLTYSGHPVSCAAGVENLAIYEEEHIFERVDELGAHLAARLEAMKAKYACVGDVRYKGLFSVLELVKDKATKEPLAPFNGTSPEMNALAAHIKSKHVYAYSRFNFLWVCPPLVITKDELDAGLDVYEEGLAKVDALLGAGAR